MTTDSMTNDVIQVRDRTFRPFIRRDEIDAMVRSIAKGINEDFMGREVVLLVILRGAMVFASDLMRHLSMPVTIEAIRTSSYGDKMRSPGTVNVEDVVLDIEGRDVIIVEDIIDTGTTMQELIKHLGSYAPASVSVAALLSKPDLHDYRIQIDYVGREIAPDFVVGYGMDYAGMGRNLDGIWIVDTEDDT
jgi:hypoxanthine phosphoribosyltransferase